MRVIICGGRHFEDGEFLLTELDKIRFMLPITFVIEGGAIGADALAQYWAKSRGVPYVTVDADWFRYRDGAGPRRNRKMLYEHHPDVVIAFPGGSGTADMKRIARAASVPVLELESGLL